MRLQGSRNCTRNQEHKKCMHCGGNNHTIDYFWDLHGKSLGLPIRNSIRMSLLQHQDRPLYPIVELISISKDGHALHQKWVASYQLLHHHSSLVKHCTPLSFLSTSYLWVINSGAIEHMIGAIEHMIGVFTNLFGYRIVTSPQSVTLPNSSLTKVQGSKTTRLMCYLF